MLAQAGDRSSIASPRSTKWVGVGEPPSATRRTPLHGSPASVKIQRLPASRAASSAGQADVAVVGHVEAEPPQVSVWFIETTRSGRMRRMAGGEVASQREAVLDDAVGVAVEELDRLDPDHRGARPLLGLAQRAGLRRGPCRRSRPHRASPAGTRRACRPRSSARSRRRRRTRGRRGGRRCRARAPSRRETGRAWASRSRGLLVEGDVDTPPRVVADDAPRVTTAGRVLGQQHVAGAELEHLTAAGRELEPTREREHVLTPGGRCASRGGSRRGTPGTGLRSPVATRRPGRGPPPRGRRARRARATARRAR